MLEDPNRKIVNCEFVFKCPQQWDKMDETETEDVRFCGECRRNVYFAEDEATLAKLSSERKCVAVYSAPEETHLRHDLNYSPVSAGIPVEALLNPTPPSLPPKKCAVCNATLFSSEDFCPRCGIKTDGSGEKINDFEEFSRFCRYIPPDEPIVEKASFWNRFSNFFSRPSK